MADALPVTFPLRLETAPSVCSALVETLSELSVSGLFLNQLISSHVKAVCIDCGTSINGDELLTAALSANAGPLKDVRLVRLMQGCCCREGCESDYYRLILTPNPSVNWVGVAEKLAAIQTRASAKRRKSGLLRVKPRLVLKVAAGIGLLAMLLVLRHLISNGSIPGLKREPKYRIDPASVLTGPPR